MIDAVPSTEIIITAERAPEEAADTPASVVVIDRTRIDRLGEPLVSALLRLTPSVAVTTSGPAGSLTEVRIRGAENNHTLLFIDGIRANDPATSNFPRFELLNSDVTSRIEVVRGPQSALWGSEAVGGVVAVDGVSASRDSYAVTSEAGSFGFRRASASGMLATDEANLALGIGWQRANGIDAFDGTTATAIATFRVALAGPGGLPLPFALALQASLSQVEANSMDFARFFRSITRTRSTAAGTDWLQDGSGASSAISNAWVVVLGAPFSARATAISSPKARSIARPDAARPLTGNFNIGSRLRRSSIA